MCPKSIGGSVAVHLPAGIASRATSPAGSRTSNNMPRPIACGNRLIASRSCAARIGGSPPRKYVLCHQCRGHRRRPPGVKGEMSNQLTQFLLAEAVVERAAEMTDQLPLAAERHQGRDRDQAAVAFRQARALP